MRHPNETRRAGERDRKTKRGRGQETGGQKLQETGVGGGIEKGKVTINKH
jgi:hypothetical protein